jgi:hypothetical protein
VGVKYTPIPPLSVSVTQRKAEGGRQDTVVGLSFTYPFDLSWSQLTRRTRSNNSATVEGFRYEFVTRENRIPLARRERKSGSEAPFSSYAYDLSALEVDISGDLSGTVKVTNASNGSPASGVAVTLSYATFGGNGTADVFTFNLGATDGAGEVILSGQNVTALVRRIRFTANNDIQSAVTITVGTLPTDFLTGQSLAGYSNYKNNSDAAAYCASHGGRLPFITVDGTIHDGSNPWDGTGTTVFIDGFGNKGRPWSEVSLPSGGYWTGSERSSGPGVSWGVGNVGGIVGVSDGGQSDGLRVACVP